MKSNWRMGIQRHFQLQRKLFFPDKKHTKGKLKNMTSTLGDSVGTKMKSNTFTISTFLKASTKVKPRIYLLTKDKVPSFEILDSSASSSSDESLPDTHLSVAEPAAQLPILHSILMTSPDSISNMLAAENHPNQPNCSWVNAGTPTARHPLGKVPLAQGQAPPPQLEPPQPLPPNESKLPHALEKILAFKDVGMTPEEIETMHQPDDIDVLVDEVFALDDDIADPDFVMYFVMDSAGSGSDDEDEENEFPMLQNNEEVSYIDDTGLTEDKIIRDKNNPLIYIRKHMKDKRKLNGQPPKKGSRVHNNYHACYICDRLVLHINIHMLAHPMVKEELKQKKKEFGKLRKLGDDKHNKKTDIILLTN